MKYPRIQQAKAIDDTTLVIEFNNQEVKKYDIHPLLETPMFALLQQPAFFKNFMVESGGYAIVWTEDIDISAYELWRNGVIVASGHFAGDRIQ
ncbi:MAG: DUF2442 domain-containing protein [Leptolyngbyaceae cyanobacterium CSU_1_3]|nr:DUF2442 domain-containing protein [Leptolyngbyaceae cyanobacterium CSU_1_3]